MLICRRTPEQSDSSSVNRMQEYLTGLSEQYSAFQAMMGQAAQIQQIQQLAAASQSAQQQAALAQYMTQMAAVSSAGKH